MSARANEPSSVRANEPSSVRANEPLTPYLVALLAFTALALWMVWPAFSPGRIVNLDAPRHLLRTVVMARQFLPEGHIDGWSPWWFLGAQLFLFQSYGYFALIGASALLASPFFTIGQVFKVWYVLPIVLLPASTALLARRLGVARRGAAMAALASIVFTSPLGYGVYGMFGVGLLLQGAGVIAFAVAWPELLLVLLDPRRSLWRAVLLLAATMLLHFITGAYTLAASGGVALYLSLRNRDLRPLARYAPIAVLVLLIAGHSLFPSLELSELSGSHVGWGNDADRFWRLLTGSLFGAQPLAVAAILAAGWSIRRAGAPLAISAVVFFITAALGGSNEQSWEPVPVEKLLEIMVRPRALPYAALFQAVFVGVAFDRILIAFERMCSRAGRPALARVAPIALMAAVLGASQPVFAWQRRFVRTESMLDHRDHRVYLRLTRWLRAHVQPPAVISIPRLIFPQSVLGARSVVSMLNLDTGIYTLTGDQSELAKSSLRAAKVDFEHLERNSSKYAGLLRAAAVSYVVLGNRDARARLAGNGDFTPVYEFEQQKLAKDRADREPIGFTIYRVAGTVSWLRGPGLVVQSMQHAPEQVSWDVETRPGRKTKTAIAAINWHPNWSAYADGQPLRVHSTPARRIAIDVPDGTSEVTLVFERRAREKLYDAISALVLLAVLAVAIRDARRRRMLAAHGVT